MPINLRLNFQIGIRGEFGFIVIVFSLVIRYSSADDEWLDLKDCIRLTSEALVMAFSIDPATMDSKTRSGSLLDN